MGLFNFFKKKPKHEDLVRAVYTFIENKDKKLVNILYPGGIEELGKIIISLSLICKIELEKCPPETYLKLGELYSMTMLQCGFEDKDIKEIVAFLKSKYAGIVVTDEIGIGLFVFCKLHSEDKTFFLNNESSINQFAFYVAAQINAEEITKSNISVLENNLSDDDYGLVETKPIYVSSAVGARHYLENLCGMCGEYLFWERVGTVDVDGINGIVDIYEAKTTAGDCYIKLYLNLYAPSTSTTIPKGLSSKEEIAKKLPKFEEIMNIENYDSNKIRSTLFRNQQFDDSEYGLSECNPIITSSDSATESYLARLRSANKELLFWVKEGTMIVNDINGISNVPVDIYQLFLHGEKLLKIYICSYGRDSSNVPQNLSLAEKPLPGHSGDLNKEALSQNKSIEIILALQKLDWENEELKKIRKKEELNRKQKIQEIIFGVIKKYPDTYLKEFSALLDQPLDISSICELIHNKDKFEKKVPKCDVNSDEMYDFNYVFNFLKSTISKPSNILPSPEEAVDLAKENEMTVEQYMAMKALENENAQILYDRRIENFKKWSKQAEELQKEYPQFLIQQEYMIEEFKTILNISDVKTAYEIIHFPELYTLSKKEELSKENSDTLFCRKCGTKIPGDSVFCYKCGQKVEK